MNKISVSGSIPLPIWLFGAITFMVLTGCATTRSAEEEQNSEGEMVDIGYGSVEEEHLVGSVTTVRSEDLPLARSRTLAEMLRGQPGVQVSELPGGQVSVRIRGDNSLLGGKEPLWVVDGMVYSTANGGLGSINPSNIESITVLKDAASTAIYGSRGANGVILIKTKRR